MLDMGLFLHAVANKVRPYGLGWKIFGGSKRPPYGGDLSICLRLDIFAAGKIDIILLR